MTLTFLVISASNPMLPVPVQGTGDNTITAKQSAVNVARTLKKIPAPIVLDSREGVLALRRWADKHARELVNIGALNGLGSPWWMEPSSITERYYKN